MLKRYQYWGIVDGKPQKIWTEWFPSKGTDKIQLKGYKNDLLLNEYKLK